MKVIIVLSAVLCVVHSTMESCYVGANVGEAETTACTNSETKCKSPTWTDYAGYSSVGFACGSCTVGQTGCEDCQTEKDCNGPVETATFQCYTWTYSNDEAAFTKGENLATCTIEKGGTTTCNSPTEDAKKDTYSSKYSGCGPCDGTLKTDGTCEECNEDKCNKSAVLAVSSLLVALAAICNFILI